MRVSSRGFFGRGGHVVPKWVVGLINETFERLKDLGAVAAQVFNKHVLPQSSPQVSLNARFIVTS